MMTMMERRKEGYEVGNVWGGFLNLWFVALKYRKLDKGKAKEAICGFHQASSERFGQMDSVLQLYVLLLINLLAISIPFDT